LQVIIEKQLVQRIADIVMMRDIALGPVQKIDTIEAASYMVTEFLEYARFLKPSSAFKGTVGTQQLHQLHDITLFDHKSAVHEGFGCAQPWIKQYLPYHCLVGQPNTDIRIAGGRRPEIFGQTVRMDDLYRPFFDHAF
jgi:hypothetical protein